jgi:hypothetical protein
MFLRAAARNAQNVILGTATPIQLDAVELWDLLSALNQSASQVLEQEGLLKRIGVIAHPRSGDGLPSNLFDGEGLIMSIAFNAAYEAAEAFSRLYAARQPGAGFLKTILLRRIGSSARAGLETPRHLLGRIEIALPEEEVGDEGQPTDEAPPDPQEIELLREVERNLAAVVGGTGTDRATENPQKRPLQLMTFRVGFMGTRLHSQQGAVDYLAAEIVGGHPHRDGKILLLSNCLRLATYT